MNPITTLKSSARRVALFVLALTALLFGGAAPALDRNQVEDHFVPQC
jgi:hypothetical protein